MPKIPTYPNLTSPDAADEFPIEDTSAGTTKRLNLGNLRTWLGASGWIDIPLTFTFVDAETMTCAADLTGVLAAGDKIKVLNPGLKQFFIASTPTYGSGVTTVKLKDGIDGATTVLASGTISSPYYSKVQFPAGFPVAATFYDKARLNKTANQSIPSSTVTAITWDVEEFDTNKIHDNSVSNTKIVIKNPGYYHISLNLFWAGTVGGIRQQWVEKNGGSIRYGYLSLLGADSVNAAYSSSDTVYCAAGDELVAQVFQSTAGAINVPFDSSLKLPSFSVTQLP